MVRDLTGCDLYTWAQSVSVLFLTCQSNILFVFNLEVEDCIKLLHYFEYSITNVDNSSQVDAGYLDPSKAFDTIPHSELLSKL